MAAPSVDELLEALRQALAADAGPDDALTSAEWGQRLGCTADTARGRIKRLIRDGRVELVTVRRVDMKGIEQPVAAYRLTEEN